MGAAHGNPVDNTRPGNDPLAAKPFFYDGKQRFMGIYPDSCYVHCETQLEKTNVGNAESLNLPFYWFFCLPVLFFSIFWAVFVLYLE